MDQSESLISFIFQITAERQCEKYSDHYFPACGKIISEYFQRRTPHAVFIKYNGIQIAAERPVSAFLSHTGTDRAYLVTFQLTATHWPRCFIIRIFSSLDDFCKICTQVSQVFFFHVMDPIVVLYSHPKSKHVGCADL